MTVTLCAATELTMDIPGGEVCQCVLEEGHEGEHQCHHGFHFTEDKKLCLVHQISKRLCGCDKVEPSIPREDRHRDFTKLSVGMTVRFARGLREIDLCSACRKTGVYLESKHRGVKRRAWVHDAVTGPTGYLVGHECVEYIYPPQRKRKKR